METGPWYLVASSGLEGFARCVDHGKSQIVVAGNSVILDGKVARTVWTALRAATKEETASLLHVKAEVGLASPRR